MLYRNNIHADRVEYQAPGSRSLTQVHTNVHCCYSGAMLIFYISMIWYGMVFVCYGMLFLCYAMRYSKMIWYGMLSYGMVCYFYAMLWDLSKRSFFYRRVPFILHFKTLFYRFFFYKNTLLIILHVKRLYSSWYKLINTWFDFICGKKGFFWFSRFLEIIFKL